MFGSFLGSCLIMAIIIKEVVAITFALGVIGNWSESFLDMSILSWGNQLSTLISSILLARNGHTEMALASCFANPMLSMFNLYFIYL